MYNEWIGFERIITPNRRLASFLSKQMVASLPENQLYTGKILAWQDFLQDCWQEFRNIIQQQQPRVLLSPWQSHYYWQQVIAKNDHDMPLLDTAQTVHLVKQAHGLLQQWRYNPDKLHGIKPDTDLFLYWQQEYQQLLIERQSIDESQIASCIESAHTQNSNLNDDPIVGVAPCATRASTACDKIPKNILLYGFDALTPEQQDLFGTFEKQGSNVQHAQMPKPASTIKRGSYKNIKEEITSIALQIKAQLDENPEPTLPLTVVVPQLKEHWRVINDIFIDVFSPYHYLPVADKKELPFNISAGQPLYEMPLVCAAWTLFDLLNENVSIETWMQLCRSPFVAQGISEMPARARFESKLRKTQADSLTWEWVLAQKTLPHALSVQLQAAFKLLQEKPNYAKSSDWQTWLLQWLQHWGWPGERNLNSEEYQTVTHFYRLLNELVGLDVTMGQVNSKAVLSQLRSQAMQRMFQGESEDKPIQVLGMLEAAGQQFSKLWITGLSHDVWPQKPSPNPFIPTHIQIEQTMPHANAEREYDYAKTMLQRLLTASDTVHISFAQYDLNSDSKRLPSPLIQDFSEQDYHEIAHDENLLYKLQKTKAVSQLPPNKPVAFKNHAAKGGAGIFKDQAACPFRAYAKYRLRAVAPELPVLGVSPKVKGILLHGALETIWKDLQAQQNLQAMDEQALTQLCEQHLNKAFEQISPKLSRQQQALEQRRALPLLLAWLQLEKTRDSFKVESIETSRQAIFADLPLNLRLDRIDALPDGSFLLIDYKTGDAKSKSWLGLRPDEPQLPLYISMMKTPPSGIAFAVLRKKKVELISLNQENSDWQQHLKEWREAIEQLAIEFKEGRADLMPKYGPQTCLQCDLQLFCRIGEH